MIRRLFVPILAGATLRDRLWACVGAAIGIALTGVISAYLLPGLSPLWLVAPMGASAVLIYAVPASPLAQPWSVVGGNVVSALVGIALVKLLGPSAWTAGLAVGGAILAMSLLRCLHPPGGAAALTAVIGGPLVLDAGWAFALAPVGVNAMLMAALGILFHRFSGHSYPHRPAPVAMPALLHPEDIEKALDDLDETFDIAPEDLAMLLSRAEAHAIERRTKPAPRR